MHKIVSKVLFFFFNHPLYVSCYEFGTDLCSQFEWLAVLMKVKAIVLLGTLIVVPLMSFASCLV